MNDATQQPVGRPIVSVVIPTYLRPDSVRAAVRSVLAQDLDPARYEVIVVDTSPDDVNLRVVEELRADARCALRLLRKDAEGPAASRNRGAADARGEILAFMDSDCQATPSWLREGLAAFDEGIGLVQGRTLPDPDRRPGVFTWFVIVEAESHIYEAANVFYRRQAFEAVGGFSTEWIQKKLFVVGAEDLDLAWRVKRAGWRSRFAHDALVHHEVQPIPISRWLVIRRNWVWPLLVGRFPELRRFFYARYFFERAQALLVLALLGVFIAVALAAPVAALLALPYACVRAMEPTRTLRGPLRLLRVLVYLPRDLITLGILTASSIRHRTLLL